MFERLQGKVDFYLDHPGEHEIILALDKYFVIEKNVKKRVFLKREVKSSATIVVDLVVVFVWERLIQ